MSLFTSWWQRFYHSIFTRTLLVLLLAVVAINAGRAVKAINFLRDEIAAATRVQQLAVAQDVAKTIAHEVALRASTLQSLAADLPSNVLDQPVALDDWLHARQALLSQLFDALVVESRDGAVIAANPEMPSSLHASNLDGVSVFPVELSDGSLVLSMLKPLSHVAGNTDLQLRGTIKLGKAGFLDMVHAHSNGKSGGAILVFPKQHLFMTVSEPDARPQKLPVRGANVLLDLTIAGIQPSGSMVNPQGQDVLAAVSAVPGLAWSVVAYMPTEEAFLLADHWLAFTQEIAPYVLLFLFLIVFPGTFLILRPAWRTAQLADQMSRGESPLVRLPITRPDEIGAMTAAFNRLLERLEEQSKELILQKEQAETATLAKSRFLAAASHDLRQPMHALNLYLGALAHFELPSAARPVMASARECAQTMDEMFRALLDISRLDASVMMPNISTFPIAPLLEKIKNNYIQQAHAKGLALRVARCSAYVTTDPELLERVLSNLVSNAVRYTDHGKILLGCRRTDKVLRVGVFDTGIGIAADQQHLVFEEFYQVGNAGRDRAQGLGLGLAIVQRLAILLNAPLAFTSMPGRGTVFFIDVKRAHAAPVVSVPVISAVRRHDGTFKGALIAVIDDEPLIQDATALVLRQWGCEVVTAASGAEIVERLSLCKKAPDAIVCDHRLRGTETGIDVIVALRIEFNSDIPAILITGDASPQRMQSIEATGIPVLNKPLQDHVLMDALLRLLNDLPIA